MVSTLPEFADEDAAASPEMEPWPDDFNIVWID
jgi:hypothetical protein